LSNKKTMYNIYRFILPLLTLVRGKPKLY